MRRYLGLLPVVLAGVAAGCATSDAETPKSAAVAAPPPAPLTPGVRTTPTPMSPAERTARMAAARERLKRAVKAADSANAFGFDLFRAVAKQKPGENLFLSPASLALALGMTFDGAGGETAAVMAKVLRQPGDKATADTANAALQTTLAWETPKTKFSIANALWADEKFPFRADFTARCQATYGASVASLPLSGITAADTINAWCAQATHGLIPRLVMPNDLRGAAGVLTDAVYFKGDWVRRFQPHATADQPFHPEGGAEYTVPMMHKEEEGLEYRAPAPDGPQIVRLRYGYVGPNPNWVIYAILPPEGQPLSAFLSELTEANWRKWRGEFRPTRVRLSLPRFKAEFQDSMVAPLTSLGMGTAFSPDADFSAMFDRPQKFSLHNVIHKAVVKVNEMGTEAAAATANIAFLAAAPAVPPRAVEVTLDRPFVCAIVHEPTGAIAFLGAFPHPEPNRG